MKAGSSTVAGASIAWWVTGADAGRPLVLLHALGYDHRMWLPPAERLAPDRPVLMIDLRGHGASASPPGPYTMETLATDVLAAADDAGLDRFHLCGISLGGQLALWLASHRTDRVASLIACNTAARIGTPDYWQERIETVEKGGMEAVREVVISRFFRPGFAQANPKRFAEANEVFASTDPVGYIGCMHALAETDLGPDLAAIRIPSLLITGELDVATPPPDTYRLGKQIPGSEVLVLEGAAHLPNLDHPAEFWEAVEGFLIRLEASG